MANEILFPASATGSYKAVVTKGANVWNGSAMVALAAAAKAAGAITLARQGTTLDYLGTFPAGIAVAGRYTITIINASSPDGTEPPVGVGDLDWTGTAENVPSDAALTASLATVNTNVTTVAGYVDTEVGAIKAKTDNLPAIPADNTLLTAAKVIMDKLDTMMAGSGPYTYTGAALVNAPAASGGGAITLDLTQAVPSSNTPGTVGDALAAARAQGFGKWTKTGTSLVLFGPDGTTPVRTFVLNDSVAPTART